MLIADPAGMLRTAERVDFLSRNNFSVESGPYGQYLRSQPQKSASGLYQPVNLRQSQPTSVTWSWRVDQIHRSADITKQNRQDFAAMVAFVFGNPTVWNRDVPTLAYVWTSTPVPDRTVIRSSRFKMLRFVQLHGPRDRGKWLMEARNVMEDFEAAFGEKPGELSYIGIFNDNDQTGEPASAAFGPIFTKQMGK